jgi:hypothetical protein
MKFKNFSEIKTALRSYYRQGEKHIRDYFDNMDKQAWWDVTRKGLLVILVIFIWLYLFSPFENKKKEEHVEEDVVSEETFGDKDREEVKGEETTKETGMQVNPNDTADSDDKENEADQLDPEKESIEETDPSPSPGSPSAPSPSPNYNPDPPPSTSPSNNLKSNGVSCSSSSECSSGFCIDGVCCDSSCQGECMRCDSYDGSAGTCHYIKNNNDPDEECSVGEYTCSGKCKLARGDGACDGKGACDNNDDIVNVSEGHVCVNGTEEPVSSDYYCFRGDSCEDGDCTAQRWFTSCDGTGSCRPSAESPDEKYDFIEDVQAEHSFTLTDSCETDGLTFCGVAGRGMCGTSGCRVMREAYRCDFSDGATIKSKPAPGDSAGFDECSYPAGIDYEYCAQGEACQNGACSVAAVCDENYRYFSEVDDECQSSCDGSGSCDYPSSYCEQSYKILGLENSNLSVFENSVEGSREIDLTEVPQSGVKEVAVWKGDKIIASLEVDFANDLNWSNLTGGTTEGKSFLHYDGGISDLPGINGVSYALYIPKQEGEKVAVCPGADSLEDVDGNCDGLFYMESGERIGEAAPVSVVDIHGKEFWKVPGLTSTGAFTLAGIKDTCDRLQVSEASDHEIRFMPTFSIDSSGDTVTIDFVPNQATTDGSQDYDFNSIGVDDIQFEDDGVSKTLGNSAGAGVWGVNIDSVDDIITFTAPTDAGPGALDSGSTVYVRIGLVAGDTQIINPSVASSYEISVRLNNGTDEDFGKVEIPIVDDDTVNVTGYIDTTLSFDIDTAVIDTDCDASGVNACNSHSGISDGSGYVVDLGEMSITSVNRSGTEVMHADGLLGDINYIWFDIETNSRYGGVVTMLSLSDALVMDGSNQIDTVSDGVEEAIAPASGLYGINHRSGFTNGSAYGLLNVQWDCDCSNGDSYYCDVSGTTPAELFNTNGQPVDDGRIQFGIGAAPNSGHATGVYTDQITFIATATF